MNANVDLTNIVLETDRLAYDDLRRFFKKHRFLHRQGSGYISEDNWICS